MFGLVTFKTVSPSSRADSVSTFAIVGQACLRQKALHNILACLPKMTCRGS